MSQRAYQSRIGRAGRLETLRYHLTTRAGITESPAFMEVRIGDENTLLRVRIGSPALVLLQMNVGNATGEREENDRTLFTVEGFMRGTRVNSQIRRILL